MSWGMGNYLPQLDLPAPTPDALRVLSVKPRNGPASPKADKANTRERRMAIQGPPTDLKVVVPQPRPSSASPLGKPPAASTSSAAKRTTMSSSTSSRFSVARSLSMYSNDTFYASTAPSSPGLDVPPPTVPSRSPLRGASAKVASRTSFATFIESYTLRDLVEEPPPLPSTHKEAPPTPTTPTTKISKREHALHELLNTERSYANDLAIIRDVHIPLALGLPAPYAPGSATSTADTPESSRSSTFTASSASSDGLHSSAPMSQQDIKIIFSNVHELALFAEVFSDKLEVALGEVLEGGRGKDRVGSLFLEVVSEMTPLYTTYITRHPTALTHLNSLSSSPSLQRYLAHTKQLASAHTHAWDLQSLLIKPVQRLLKYPLLLHTLIDGTPEGHPDKTSLRQAKEKLEALARGVNENRRRLEVVKQVLEGKPTPIVPAAVRRSLTAAPLARMRSFRISTKPRGNGTQSEGALAEQEEIERTGQRLRMLESVASGMSRQVLDWSQAVRDAIGHLGHWATGFGRVIGLGPQHGSESLTAFGDVVEEQILPLWADLDTALQSVLVPQLCAMVATASGPHILLAHLKELRPNHDALVHTPYAKAKPTPAQLEMEAEYGAISAQLRAEMPRYLELMERGIALAVRRFAMWQATFWGEVAMRWAALWEALGVEGEGDANTGAGETVRVWWERWEEVERMVAELNLVNPAAAKLRRPSIGGRPSMSHHPYSQPAQHVPQSARPSHTRATHSVSSVASGSGQGHPAARSRSGRRSEPVELQAHMQHHGRHLQPHPREASEADAASIAMSDGFDVDGAEEVLRALSLGDELRDDYSDGWRSHSRSISYSQPARSRSQSRGRPVPQRASGSSGTRSPNEFLSIDPNQPAMYSCTAVQMCMPSTGARYAGLPFLILAVGDLVDVLLEGGHPARLQEELPIILPSREDEEDTLLIVRDERGRVGWALASFLLPLT
ncbi:hypothetical protein BKA62DRAFT_118078 [Auriculariales sp. MPI-PUGE-AT-0066]|nr:hypothetical protein BKA62DRAFT_118078 [Auriculariales sp. MPI-PUGE-AT-0066]